MPSDIGRFLARYLQAVAVLHAVQAVVALFWDVWIVPVFSVLLLWTARGLQRHSTIARGFVLLGGWCWIVMGAGMLIELAFRDVPAVDAFGWRVERPSVLTTAGVAVAYLVIGAIPVGLFATEQAHREFAGSDYRARGLCGGCGYDLRGSRERSTCPECGAAIPVTPPASSR